MAVLLLSLGGPLQSWGSRSRFSERDTEREPTKSGVVGLLAAALGRHRGESVEDLAALRMLVRVDQEGVLLRDFHTALGVALADGSGPSRHAVVSNRYYLCDALFLVALEGPATVLEAARQALRAPRWPLALGRRNCPPSVPLIPPAPWDAEQDAAVVLQSYPWLPELYRYPVPRERPATLRLVEELPVGEGAGMGEIRSDVPVDFAGRRMGLRRVRQRFVAVPEGRVSGRDAKQEEGPDVSDAD